MHVCSVLVCVCVCVCLYAHHEYDWAIVEAVKSLIIKELDNQGDIVVKRMQQKRIITTAIKT